jgi:Domain of unknown function (DUF4124)
MVRPAVARRPATAWFAVAVVSWLLAGVATAGQSGTVLYKWVDADGVVHYSDQPHDGAEKIKVAKPQTYAAPPPPARAVATPGTRAATGPAGPAVSYTRVALLSPSNDDVYTNTDGRVGYSVAVEPGLGTGHQIWILLDGQRVDGAGTASTDGTLTGVERGTHTLMAEVVDQAGRILGSSESVTFSVNQTRLKPTPQPR